MSIKNLTDEERAQLVALGIKIVQTENKVERYYKGGKEVSKGAVKELLAFAKSVGKEGKAFGKAFGKELGAWGDSLLG